MYLNYYRDSLRASSGSWMNIGKVNLWYMDDCRDSLRSTSSTWVTMGKV